MDFQKFFSQLIHFQPSPFTEKLSRFSMKLFSRRMEFLWEYIHEFKLQGSVKYPLQLTNFSRAWKSGCVCVLVREEICFRFFSILSCDIKFSSSNFFPIFYQKKNVARWDLKWNSPKEKNSPKNRMKIKLFLLCCQFLPPFKHVRGSAFIKIHNSSAFILLPPLKIIPGISVAGRWNDGGFEIA